MVTIARAPIAVLPNVGMSQSTVLVGALIGGFAVWLALNQKLGAYWSILIGGGSSATTATTPATTTGATTTGAAATPSNTSLGLPTTLGSVLGLGGTSSTATAATGGTGTATATGIAGLPNTSLTNFFGLGGG
jgi:hypothetical protein